MTAFTKTMLEHLAGLSDPQDRFTLEEERQECVFYPAEEPEDEITRRRLHRATHQKMERMAEDRAMGQVSRQRVPMYSPNAGVRAPQSYLTDPQFDDPIPTGHTLRDIFLTPDDELEAEAEAPPEEFEEESETPTDTVNSYGYGHGRQSGRRPGFGARSAGYITNNSE